MGRSASAAVGILIPATWMYCESTPNVVPATSVVHVGRCRSRCASSSNTFSESTMARRRRTATESWCSASPYNASATGAGSAGRGSTHNRPSPRRGPPASPGIPVGTTVGGTTCVATGSGLGGRTGRASGAAGRTPPGRPAPPRLPPRGGPAPRPRPPRAAPFLAPPPLERRGGDAIGKRHPEVHRGARRLALEAPGDERRCHRVTPLAESLHVGTHEGFRPLEHGGTRGLDREKRSRVHVVLHAGQRPDQVGPARSPRQPPPGHAETLRQGVELHSHVLRPGDLEDARRH